MKRILICLSTPNSACTRSRYSEVLYELEQPSGQYRLTCSLLKFVLNIALQVYYLFFCMLVLVRVVILQHLKITSLHREIFNTGPSWREYVAMFLNPFCRCIWVGIIDICMNVLRSVCDIFLTENISLVLIYLIYTQLTSQCSWLLFYSKVYREPTSSIT